MMRHDLSVILMPAAFVACAGKSVNSPLWQVKKSHIAAAHPSIERRVLDVRARLYLIVSLFTFNLMMRCEV